MWAGEAGEAAADFVSELRVASAAAPQVSILRFPALLDALLRGGVVRPRYGRHPRVAILGPLEARLHHPDLVILGGLNEGTWPALVEAGPWLSRPMQRDFGLPLPERRIGLAAHDFIQAFAAPKVVLTRAAKVEGTPTVASRWLRRLEALRDAFDLTEESHWQNGSPAAWARRLDEAEAFRPHPRPEPRPPLAARPRQLSVTAIETWMRDPYGLYAGKILGLRALEPLDADPSAAQRGNLVHIALEFFVKRYPEDLPPNPEKELLKIGEEVFAEIDALPGVATFWWPRFQRVAAWFAEMETGRRPGLRRSLSELSGRLEVDAPGGSFSLTAKADRIDIADDGSLVIADYKTGQPPAASDVALGLAPQLPLEGAIAANGGFKGVSAGDVTELAFWHLMGRAEPGVIKPVGAKEGPGLLIKEALAGLEALIAEYDDPETPYTPQPRASAGPRYNDFAHLERLREWSSGEEGEAS